jgi:heme-degrading monooxygenase HmoA
MLRAYELVSPDGNEVVGITVWDSVESRDQYRLSEAESDRRHAMAPYVMEEVSGFYLGRELKIPRD